MIEALPIDRFYQIVASYGADPNRWPGGERAGAVRCLTENEGARQAWHKAAETDAGLDILAEPEVSPALVRDVAALADKRQARRPNPAVVFVRNAVPYAAAAAIALVIGLGLPSPLRDAPAAPPQTAAVGNAPDDAGLFATGATDLTALALIDAALIGDGTADTSAATQDTDPLLQLPLL